MLLFLKYLFLLLTAIMVINCSNKSHKETIIEKFTEIDYEKEIKIDCSNNLDTLNIATWIKNIGETPLTIKHIKTSCGCTNIITSVQLIFLAINT